MFGKFRIRICLILLAVSLFLGSNDFAYALDDSLFGTNNKLLIEATTDKMIYKVNQEVVITVYLKNKTQEPIDLVEPAVDKASFMFEIIFPDGKKDKLLDIYGLNLKTIRLYPKKRVKFTAKFTPEVAGNYDVRIKYNGYKDQEITVPSMRVFVVSAPPIEIE